MDALSSIFTWLSENEATISAVVSTVEKERHMKVQIVSSVIVVVVTLAACTDASLPTEADARSVFVNWSGLGEEFEDGTVRFTYFRKVNGQSGEYAGVKLYTLEFEAEIEYPNGRNTECLNEKKGHWSCVTKDVREKGEKRKFESEVFFEETENGWRGDIEDIYYR